MVITHALALLAGGAVGAISCDLLHGRGRSSWPVALAVLAVSGLGGLLYEPHVVGVGLGMGIAWLLLGTVHKVGELAEQWRIVREAAARRRALEKRRLEL